MDPPKLQAHVNLHLSETRVHMCLGGGGVRGRWPFIGEKISFLGNLVPTSVWIHRSKQLELNTNK
jgi:hypothetical protein